MEQFLQGNVPLRHLLNEETLFISWRISAFNEVNDMSQYVPRTVEMECAEACLKWESYLPMYIYTGSFFIMPNHDDLSVVRRINCYSLIRENLHSCHRTGCFGSLIPLLWIRKYPINTRPPLWWWREYIFFVSDSNISWEKSQYY